MSRFLTAREVADRLGVAPDTVLRWVRAGELPAHKLHNGRIRFDEIALEEWLKGWATPRRGALTTTPGAAQSPTVPSLVLTTTEDEET